MGFFSKLFGGGAPKEEAPAAEAIHEGYTIRATPLKDGAQYRLHGTISKGDHAHTLIRADTFGSREDCATATINKAKQVIAEQGDGMFR